MKRIICIFLLAMFLLFGFTAYAEETVQEDTTAQTMPQMPRGGGGMRGPGGGGRGGMQPPGMKMNNSGVPSEENVSESANQNENMPWGNRPQNGEMPFEDSQNTVVQEQQNNIVVNHFTLIATVAALIFGFIFVIFYKR